MNLTVWLIVILSAFLHAWWNLATKQVKGDLGIICLGMGLAALVAAPFGLFGIAHSTLVASAFQYLLIRGFLQTAYFLTLAYAYRSGDLSFIYPIARGTGVAVAALLAAFFLREQLSPLGIAGISAVVLGTLSVAGHPSRNHLMTALQLAVLTGITVGLMSINDKLSTQVISLEVYIFLMHLLCFLLLLPYVLVHHGPQFRDALHRHLPASTIVGVGSMLSYFLILEAFRFGKVSYVAPVRELAVVMGAGMGVLVLKEDLTPRKALGIAAIALGAGLIKMA